MFRLLLLTLGACLGSAGAPIGSGQAIVEARRVLHFDNVIAMPGAGG